MRKRRNVGEGRLSVLAIVLGVWWMLGATTVVQGQCAPCEWVSFKHDATGVEWQEWRCSECGGSGKTGSASGGPPKPGVAVEVEPPGASPFSPYRPGGSSGGVAVLRLSRARALFERVDGCNIPGGWGSTPHIAPYKPGPDAAHPNPVQISLEGDAWRGYPDLPFALGKFEAFFAQYLGRPGPYKKFYGLRTYQEQTGKQSPAYELKLVNSPAELDDRYLKVHFKLVSAFEIGDVIRRYYGYDDGSEPTAVVTDYVVRDITDGKRIAVSSDERAKGTYSSARYEIIEITVSFNEDILGLVLEGRKPYYAEERSSSLFFKDYLTLVFTHELLLHSVLGYLDQIDSIGDPILTSNSSLMVSPGKCFASYIRRATEYARTGKWPEW